MGQLWGVVKMSQKTVIHTNKQCENWGLSNLWYECNSEFRGQTDTGNGQVERYNNSYLNKIG